MSGLIQKKKILKDLQFFFFFFSSAGDNSLKSLRIVGKKGTRDDEIAALLF